MIGAVVVLAVVLAVGIVLWRRRSAPAQSAVKSPLRTDSEIREFLAERIDKDRQSVGMVVGVIAPAGRRIVAYGSLDRNDPRPVDDDTVFEIGSVTKVFTSLLLADMVERGEVALTDPVTTYLPPGMTVPERGGRQITLQDLATHTSGLPRLPSNLAPKSWANPYADYSTENLYQFLSTYKLTRDIGSQYEYSNLGGGLLGHVLARHSGTDYGALVQSRICEPLGMKDTSIVLSSDRKARFAAGHNRRLKRVANWDLPTLAGAGALRSTANDLLVFLAAHLGHIESPLAPAMALMLAVRRPTGVPGLQVALGWHILARDGREIIWHDGGTGGYRSFIGYDAQGGIGAAVLSNANTPAGIDDVGQRLIHTSARVYRPQPLKEQIALNSRL